MLNYMFNPIYRITQKIIEKSKFNLSREFYIFLSLLIFLVSLLLNIVSLATAISTIFIILVLEFISLNFEIFVKVFTPEDKVKLFLNDLETKEFEDLYYFLNNAF